jgi:hypothetical protein
MIEETDFSVSSASFLFKILPPKDFGVFFIFPKSCPQKILEKPQEILMTLQIAFMILLFTCKQITPQRSFSS